MISWNERKSQLVHGWYMQCKTNLGKNTEAVELKKHARSGVRRDKRQRYPYFTTVDSAHMLPSSFSWDCQTTEEQYSAPSIVSYPISNYQSIPKTSHNAVQSKTVSPEMEAGHRGGKWSHLGNTALVITDHASPLPSSPEFPSRCWQTLKLRWTETVQSEYFSSRAKLYSTASPFVIFAQPRTVNVLEYSRVCMSDAKNTTVNYLWKLF